ncbi:MAG: serine/threonine-protein phosphatase, partial [Cyclobacteriaceae bacterium]|nr:serine/threonine-protein phosphatase [Cyclobacteriaceae bacterium]
PFLNEGFITDLDKFRLFCYTDGLTETINEAGEEFGLERLMTYFNDPITRRKEMRKIHNDIIVSLDDFKGRNGYHDDITLISCRVG